MPVKAVITVNDKPVTTIQIGRIKGKGVKPNDVNIYAVVETDAPIWEIDFEKSSTIFAHTYGEGVAVCVAKAIEALEDERADHAERAERA